MEGRIRSKISSCYNPHRFFGAVIGTHLGEGALGLDGIRSNKDIKAFGRGFLRIFYVKLTS